MAIFRTSGEDSFKNYGESREKHVTVPNEWSKNNGGARVDDPSWVSRYKYESGLLNSIIKENNYSKILELGSGPGTLGQFVIETNPNITYHFVDKPEAKNQHTERGYKGKFFVKDLLNEFNIEELATDYDLIVANDFLEHIANPSDVLYKTLSITHDKSSFFISVPNWRMGHTFIYRGLFDYDNWIYTMFCHGWGATEVFDSPLKCPPLPKLSSEETMPDELVGSWNWYFNFKKLS